MKKTNKYCIILLIFCVIQVFTILFNNNVVYAAGFFDNVFKSGKEWKEMQEEGFSDSDKKSGIEKGEKLITDTRDEIYQTIRYIGGAIFMASIAGTIIAINMKDKTGKDIAGLKTTLVFTFILAILFLFAGSIVEVFRKFFESLEGTM